MLLEVLSQNGEGHALLLCCCCCWAYLSVCAAGITHNDAAYISALLAYVSACAAGIPHNDAAYISACLFCFLLLLLLKL